MSVSYRVCIADSVMFGPLLDQSMSVIPSGYRWIIIAITAASLSLRAEMICDRARVDDYRIRRITVCDHHKMVFGPPKIIQQTDRTVPNSAEHTEPSADIHLQTKMTISFG